MAKRSNQFLFVIHNSKKPTTIQQWDEYISFLIKKKHLNGGSSLGKGNGLKNNIKVSLRSKTISGYMIIQCSNSKKAKNLASLCPTHVNGGQIDIFPLVRDKE